MKKSLDLKPLPGEMLKPRELIELNGTGPLSLQDRRVFNEQPETIQSITVDYPLQKNNSFKARAIK